MALIFASNIVYSMVSRFSSGRYFIYLTTWSFWVEALYFIASVDVTIRAQHHIKSREGESSRLAAQPVHLPKQVKFMWFLWSIAMPISLTVTIAFWTLLEPFWRLSQEMLDFEIVVEHLINTVLLMIEFGFCRNALHLKHIAITIGYAATFVLWSLVHFWAHIGVPSYLACRDYAIQDCPIYPILDWHHPGQSFLVVLMVAVVCIIVYVAVCFLARVRDRTARKRSGVAEIQAERPAL